MNSPATRKRRDSGHAMVEMAILAPVYLLLVVGLIRVGWLILTKQQLLDAARYVAWKSSVSRPGQEEVKKKFLEGIPGNVSRMELSSDPDEISHLLRAHGIPEDDATRQALLKEARRLWQSEASVVFSFIPFGADEPAELEPIPIVAPRAEHRVLLHTPGRSD